MQAAAARYAALIEHAVRDIGASPVRPGSKGSPHIMIEGSLTYHLSLSRNLMIGATVKESRHYPLYRRRGERNRLPGVDPSIA